MRYQRVEVEVEVSNRAKPRPVKPPVVSETQEDTEEGHLDEHNIPDFQDVGIVHIDKCRCVATPNSIIMEFCERCPNSIRARVREVNILETVWSHDFVLDM